MISPFTFVRQNESDKVFAVLNFSNESQTVTFAESLYHGRYVDYFSQEQVELAGSTATGIAALGLSGLCEVSRRSLSSWQGEGRSEG